MTTLAPAPARPAVGNASAARARELLRRPAVMCLVLFAAYFALSLLNHPRAFLGSDTGGKIATLRVMDQRGDLDPDLGYWAEPFDPDGLAHPMALTRHVGDRWVNVTTLPMIYAAVPLYAVGGLRAVLVIPMLAAVATALGARALARRLGDRGDGAFWLVGLATPVAIYALDFWEHAPGLACMVWAVVLLVGVADGDRGWPGGLAAGVLFGAAATMRTEALVYAAVAFAVLGAGAWMRRRRFPGVEVVATVCGLGAVLVANQLLERWAIGSGMRAGRASTVAERVGDDLVVRGRDALVTSVGLNRFSIGADWLLGAAIVGGVVLGTALLLRGHPRSRVLVPGAFAVVAYGYLLAFGSGLGFVPGALTASPLAAAGLAGAWVLGSARRIGIVAVLAAPLVWAFQYSNGMTAMWGGRYLLTSSTLLAVVGCVAVAQLPRAGRVAVVVLAVLVTGTGLAWMSVRTNASASGWAAVDRIPGPVVMVGEVLLLREAGAFYDTGQPWLAAGDRASLAVAVQAVERSGAEQLTVATTTPRLTGPRLGPFERRGTRTLSLMPGVTLYLARYAEAR